MILAQSPGCYFFQRVEYLVAAVGSEACPSSSHQTTSEPLFPNLTILEYDMLWTAFTVCIYDAIRILLLQLWDTVQLLPILRQTIDHSVLLDVPNRTALLGITSDIKGLACEILRSLNIAMESLDALSIHLIYGSFKTYHTGVLIRGSKEAIWITEHGWAELADSDDIGDANLLRRLVPIGQIQA